MFSVRGTKDEKGMKKESRFSDSNFWMRYILCSPCYDDDYVDFVSLKTHYLMSMPLIDNVFVLQ